MKPLFCGLIPSAMKATLTPAPLIPSCAAVFADGSDDRALIVCSASGSSIGWARSLEHARGSTVDGPGSADGVACGCALRGEGDGAGTRTDRSAVTLATAGSTASCWACAAVTRAANALTSV